MKIERNAVWATWLVVVGLLAGCASPSDAEHGSHDLPATSNVPLEKSAISANELRDLAGQPFAEWRRRLDVVITAHPDDLAARILRLRAEDALADFPAVMSDSGFILSDPLSSSAIRLEALTCRAEALIQLKRAPEALVAASEAAEIDPLDSHVLLARGWARWESDHAQAELALADIDRGLQLDPNPGGGYFRRGTILKFQKKNDRAAEDFERALQIMPNDVATHLAYGVMSLQTENFERARLHFEAAARLTPNDPSVWGWLTRADLALNRFDDAKVDANQSIELGVTGSDLADAHASLAVALQAQLDFVGANRESQRALAIDPRSVLPGRAAAMQWLSGQFAQAIAPFRELAMAPDADPYTMLWLFIVRVRADPSAEAQARAELVALAWPHRPHVWTDTLVDLLLEKTSLETALAEADTAPTGELRAGQRCEADYYAAEQLLMHGKQVQATPLLEEAYWVCPSTYLEAQAVVAERRLLAAKRPATP